MTHSDLHSFLNPSATNHTPPVPPGWKWVPVPEHSTPSPFLSMPASMQHGSPYGQWQFVPSQLCNAGSGGVQIDSKDVDDDSLIRESHVKEESLKRRQRRANKKNVDDESRRRVAAGMKPYAVQVNEEGIVDSGCRGH